MSISYVSKPVKSNPYVLPFDLNLMAKALQVKDQAFKQNAGRIQDGFNALASLPMKDEEGQAYLKGKVDNLVSQVNGLGTVDLADLNVANQINGFTNSISNDSIVTAQVAGMKAAQAQMANIEKIKYDPKLRDMYSPANEREVTRAVEAWRTDGKKDSKLGAVDYTPYTNVDKKIFDKIKLMKGTLQSYDSPDGRGKVYVYKGQELSAADIAEVAQQEIYNDPMNLKQVGINGRYLYEGYTPDNILTELSTSNNAKITDYSERLKGLEAKLAIATTDGKDVINTQIRQVKDYIAARKTYGASLTLDEIGKNRDHYVTEMYAGKVASNYGNILKVNEQSQTQKPDLTWQFAQKMDADNKKFNETMEFKREELRVKSGLGSSKLGIPAAAAGGDGNVTPAGFDNSANADVSIKINDDYLKEENKKLDNEQSDALRNWINTQSMANENIAKFFTPDLEKWFTQYGNANGVQDQGVNNNVFDISDLGAVINPENISDLRVKFGLNDKQIGFMQGIYEQWKGKSMGGYVPNVEFNKNGLTDLFTTINLNDRRKRLNETVMKEAEGSTMASLSQDEKIAYQAYLNAPATTPTYGMMGQVGQNAKALTPQVQSILNRIGKGKEEAYARISDRLQPSLVAFNVLDIKGAPAIPLVTNEIINNTRDGKYVSSQGDLFKKGSNTPINLADHNSITSVSIGTSPKPLEFAEGLTNYYAKVGLKKIGTKGEHNDEASIVYVPISKKVAEGQLGSTITIRPDAKLANDEVNFSGRTSDFGGNHPVASVMGMKKYVKSDGTEGTTTTPISFSYRIYASSDKPQGSPNRPAKGQLVVINPTTNKPETIDVTPEMPSAAMALDAMSTYLAEWSKIRQTAFETPGELYQAAREINQYYIK